MIKGNKISVIIPCKNEAKALKVLLPKISNYIDELIIVDNGSTDDTVKIAKMHEASVYSEPRTIHGIGYGYAHMKGLTVATGDYVVALDGDDTYPINRLRDITEHMESHNIDFVSCNRFPLRNKNAISILRQFGIKLLNLEVFLLYGYPIQDILTGMWVMKKSVIPKLELKEGDWNFSPEIKLEAIANKSIIFGEYHISHFARNQNLRKKKIWAIGISHLLFILKKRIQNLGKLIIFYQNLFKKISYALKITVSYFLVFLFVFLRLPLK